MRRSTLFWGGILILIGVLLLLSVVGFAGLSFVRAPGATVLIEQDGRLVARYSLDDSRTVEVHGPLGSTYVEINEGAARIVGSPCAQKTCVRMGRIRRAGEVVICVPNRVVVRIGGKPDKYTPDAVLR